MDGGTAGAGDVPDPDPARALAAAPVDAEHLFRVAVRALLTGLLRKAPTEESGRIRPWIRTPGASNRDTGGGAVGPGPYSH